MGQIPLHFQQSPTNAKEMTNLSIPIGLILKCWCLAIEPTHSEVEQFLYQKGERILNNFDQEINLGNKYLSLTYYEFRDNERHMGHISWDTYEYSRKSALSFVGGGQFSTPT